MFFTSQSDIIHTGICTCYSFILFVSAICLIINIFIIQSLLFLNGLTVYNLRATCISLRMYYAYTCISMGICQCSIRHGTQDFTNKGPLSVQKGDNKHFSRNQCYGIIIASIAQMC